MIKPVRLRPNLMAPTAFSTGKVFVMWDLHNCLIKSKQARYLVFGAQESSPTLLYNSWLHGRCQNLCWLGYACSGGVQQPLLRGLEDYVTFCYNPSNSDRGAEIELKRQISELMAQNDGAPLPAPLFWFRLLQGTWRLWYTCQTLDTIHLSSTIQRTSLRITWLLFLTVTVAPMMNFSLYLRKHSI